MSPRPLAPSDVIHGSADGTFGRNHDTCIRIEAVGPDWIVARPGNRWDGPLFAAGRRQLEACIRARDESCSECPLAEREPPLTTYAEQPYPTIGFTGGSPWAVSG